MTGAVWLASYPRSGNTWMRLALRSLRAGGEPVELADIADFGRMPTRQELIDRTLDVDSGLFTDDEALELRCDLHAALFARADPPELVKTHDAWIRTPSGRPLFERAVTHAAIYIVRDPRDVAVSWARFIGLPVDRSVAFLSDPRASLGKVADPAGIQLRQPVGTWSDHVRSWLDESALDPVTVRYEDMVGDAAVQLCRVAAALGWPAGDSAIAGAVAATHFERLSDKEARFGFREKTARTERFFHSGRSGTWRDVLSHAQAARIERDHGEVMARFGYC